MKTEEFCGRFLKVIRPENNDFRIVTKELMIENGLFLEFERFVEKGILTPMKETDKYFIDLDLLNSYIEEKSFNENKNKIISEMTKEIHVLKEQVRRLQNELNSKEKIKG